MRLEYYLDMSNRPSAPLEEKFDEQLLSVSGTPLKVKGVVSVPVRISGTVLEPDVRFFVVENLPADVKVLLGLEFIRSHMVDTQWQQLTCAFAVAPDRRFKLFPAARDVTNTCQIRLVKQGTTPLQNVPVFLTRPLTLYQHSSCVVAALTASDRLGPAQPDQYWLFEPQFPGQSAASDDVSTTQVRLSYAEVVR